MTFIVGIDLGTTNSVVACVVADSDDAAIRLVELPQLVSPGSLEGRLSLPSFLYLPTVAEQTGEGLSLPWAARRDFAVGLYAQKRGAEVPDRVVTSAKSWLSHRGVDRTAAILPWNSPDDVAKLSPVDVSARYLEHIREAWDAAHPNAPLAAQEVLVTVPASFDEVARELTTRAAHEAGLPDITLLEEPQAAFYAWIDGLGEGWRDAVQIGDRILVCDVGGGTTDLSLIAVGEEGGALRLERIAVGDHILLGGDNMDLALAYRTAARLQENGTALDAWQFRGLMQSCRAAKEQLLDAGKPIDTVPVSILGRGSKLIGKTTRFDISRTDVEDSLVDGFFPHVALDDRLVEQPRSGLQELGLPYASDPAVTRHIAHFLRTHGEAAAPAQPTAVLFNGGVMAAPALRRRTLEVIASLGGTARELAGNDLHHAVARGAAYYGLARCGRGVRIRGGTARSFYIGIETAMPAVPGMRPPIKALCVVPQGLEEGSDVALPAREFGLAVGQPVEFRFLCSSNRRDDAVGNILDRWDESEIDELAPIATTLEWEEREGTTVPIHLQARVNELGVLELWCVSRDDERRWKLEFNVRAERTK